MKKILYLLLCITFFADFIIPAEAADIIHISNSNSCYQTSTIAPSTMFTKKSLTNLRITICVILIVLTLFGCITAGNIKKNNSKKSEQSYLTELIQKVNDLKDSGQQISPYLLELIKEEQQKIFLQEHNFLAPYPNHDLVTLKETGDRVIVISRRYIHDSNMAFAVYQKLPNGEYKLLIKQKLKETKARFGGTNNQIIPIDENHVVINPSKGGVIIIDIRNGKIVFNKSTWTKSGKLKQWAVPNKYITIYGNLLFACDNKDFSMSNSSNEDYLDPSLQIIDVSDPHKPVDKGIYAQKEINPYNWKEELVSLFVNRNGNITLLNPLFFGWNVQFIRVTGNKDLMGIINHNRTGWGSFFIYNTTTGKILLEWGLPQNNKQKIDYIKFNEKGKGKIYFRNTGEPMTINEINKLLADTDNLEDVDNINLDAAPVESTQYTQGFIFNNNECSLGKIDVVNDISASGSVFDNAA